MPPSPLTRAGRVALALAGLGAIAALAARPIDLAAKRRRVVILGAGFGGLSAARRLSADRRVDLTVIDASDHHLFQPLLYQVATASLSPSDIATPVRRILPTGTRVMMARVSGIDPGARIVHCGGVEVGYDELIVATGSQPSYFGHDDWAGSAPSLKTLDDALALRTAILEAFERGARPTFVLIGGGPTGVELAGSIAELAHDLARERAVPDRARVVLIEGAERVLSAFAPTLSAYALATLEAMGVEVRTGARVTAIGNNTVSIGPQTIEAATVIWTAGTQATPVAHWLGAKPGHGGKMPVGPDLRVGAHPEIAIIGDAALALDADGKPLPGLAPVAKQQGHYVARSIRRRLRGGRAVCSFRYRDYGTLATIGRRRAVAELGDVRLEGFFAWLLWAAAHIFFLIGFRNRFMVMAQWAFAWATHARPGQSIVHAPPKRAANS